MNKNKINELDLVTLTYKDGTSLTMNGVTNLLNKDSNAVYLLQVDTKDPAGDTVRDYCNKLKDILTREGINLVVASYDSTKNKPIIVNRLDKITPEK